MLSYRHYWDPRDKRHSGDECSPRRHDKSLSLRSRDFSWDFDSTCPHSRHSRSCKRERTGVLSAAIIRALFISPSHPPPPLSLTPCRSCGICPSRDHLNRTKPAGVRPISSRSLNSGPIIVSVPYVQDIPRAWCNTPVLQIVRYSSRMCSQFISRYLGVNYGGSPGF